MKTRILILLAAGLLSFGKSATAQKASFEDFDSQVHHSFNPPESVQRFCTWHYAIVKVHLDKTRRITGYTILNPVIKGLDSSLTGIKGYRFDKRLPIKQPNLIFALTVDNMCTEPENCDTVIQRPHLSALQELKRFKATYQKKDAYFLMKQITMVIMDRIK